MTAFRRLAWLLVCVCLAGTAPALAQSTTGTIQGTVKDNQGGVIPGATVTLRNIDTGISRDTVTAEEGQWRFGNVPVGNYELTVELSGFSKYIRTGLTLALNQIAVLDIALQPATVSETIEVRADTPLINQVNSEVGVRFDTTRIAELPIGGSRNIYAIALSAPGISQLGSGQTGFTSGVQYSSNGMRTRSNNFMIDGQDGNDPSVTGAQQPINNTDVIQEVRLITNQFAAEFGRAAGSVMNVITKSGTNDIHGSAFEFYNSNDLNARSNLDKAAGRTAAPFRIEHQFGGTAGGPVLRNKTFFFGSYQRWTQRALGSGFTLDGAPTEAGRAILQSVAGSRPQVAALLKHMPAGADSGKTASFTLGGQTFVVPLGRVTGSSSQVFNNNQASGRIDHNFSANHILSGRYLYAATPESSGGGQVTPPGLTTVNTSNQHAVNVWLTSVLGANMSNEVRVAFNHLGTNTGAQNPASEEIPSLEITELGMTGFNAATNRTAIGLAVNLPQFRFNDNYQVQNNFTFIKGNHVMKAGADFRHIWVKSFFFPTIRGLLRYASLNNFVADLAQDTNINKPLPGGVEINYYEWNDQFYYVQDEWRVRPSFTIGLGLRYELFGNNVQSLVDLNENIVQTAGGNQVFALRPIPKDDKNNFQPRVGFNWSPRTQRGGLAGLLTGGDRFVLRGGYAQTNDYAFLNIALNIASSFPFVAAINQPNLANAFVALQNTPAGVPVGTDPNQLNRTVVAEDFRAPVAHQFSLEMQRALAENVSLRVGYVGTLGRDLFQTTDGNPMLPFRGTPATGNVRQDPTRGVIRLRANTASSDYHSLQTSLEQRLSHGISGGVHYTWSKYIDTASEIFNPSGAEVAVPQDSFNIRADRAVSSYDRTHRLAGNFVWELPFYRDQSGPLGKILGGWQVSSFVTLQAGAPFTVLNGADPTGALAGIAGLVGDAIRPNLNTDLKLHKMTIEEVRAAGGASLFRRLCGNPSPTCAGERVGNAGRNILRADGIGNVDFGFMKNTRFAGGKNIQIRIEMYNATNTRNFGIPEGRVNSANFLNQWGTNGGNRQIYGALRFTF
jgi:hypothetical protein